MFVIIGDFNINVLEHTDPLTQRLRDVLTSFGLEWSVNSPTRVTASSSTAIDNVITNIHTSEVSVVETAISDHFAQEVIVNEEQPDLELKTPKQKRVIQPKNIHLLSQALSNEAWSLLNNYESIDDAFDKFTTMLTAHLDATCPYKTFKSNKSAHKNDWVTQGILKSRENLKFYYAIFRQSQDENFKLFFKNYKRIYRRVIRAAKAYDVNKKLKGADNFSKTAWEIINKSVKPEFKPSSKTIKLQVGNKILQNSEEVAEEFNQFFTSIGVLDQLQRDYRPRAPMRTPLSSMMLSPVAVEDVARVIQSLKPKKSCDVNGMSVWLLKHCFKHILEPLTKLINMSFKTGVFPAQLKTAKVIPIFKKDDPCITNNYRPISILPVLSKVYEKLFFENLVSFLVRNEILSANQFGFRKNLSTIDAVTKLVETVVEALENREYTLSVFLDLSKAFDCVCHEIFLNKLETCGVRGVPLKWLQSYLTDRGQIVEIANSRSKRLPINQGVPQGSILGPILFLIYVNDLGMTIQNGEPIQFADDTTLCFKEITKAKLEIQTHVELNSCIQYFSDLNLQINSTKTNYINFCLHQHDGEATPAVMVDETLLEEVESTRFLGMYLDQGLTWNNHVEHVCARVASGIYALRNLAKFCSLDVLKMAYFGLIYPHLSYGISIWGSCGQTRFERVFKLQKKAIRIMLKINSRESCRGAFRELGLLTLPCLYVLEVTLYCRFRCELLRGRDVHRHDTRGRDRYRTRQHRTAAFERIPSQAGVSLVNALPDCAKQLTDPAKFKSRLKCLLVSEAFYSVEEFISCRWDH